MKTLRACVVIAGLCLSGVSATAEDDTAGRSLMEQGMELFLKGLQDEIAPTIEGFASLMEEIGPGLQGFLEEMGPKLGAVFSKVEDWSTYHAPEMLPNGDIIMRKKTPEEIGVPDTTENSEGVEL
ncbi:hypothetical protein [Shimia sagamensis]|uniref:AAA+ family ATPase n=1 Tax=Shimia sagamensis TaxID=1566352 RepID=A0ABY1NY36_9RHOB|nr:hypothetical protein [Shimia sagamensis]SMP21637.1 hypothetical protein SAMN06265373_10443 [Shimia sagamensis]